MKALSVRAPWWWAILHGKPVENRYWHTNFRGRIYLHAGKWWNTEEIGYDLEDIDAMATKDNIPMIARDEHGRPWSDLAGMRASGGCLVGTVEIVGCVTEHPSAFFVGKFGFVLENPVALPKPIPLKGALGFFDVPDSVLLPGAAER